MATTPGQIDFWRSAASEHQRLEFKEAKTQFDNRRLYEYCVALANEGGGHLLLGIADKPPREVVGTLAFNNPVQMAEKVFEAVGFRVDIEEVMHPDGRVLFFHIPPRPKGTAYHLDGKYLMRAGSALVPMTEDQLRRIFAEGGPDWSLQPALTDCDGEKVVHVLDTQGYFDLLHLPYPATRDAVLERFASERLIERAGSLWTITNLGAVLFAHKEFEGMDRNDRIRASYQHCCLRYVMNQKMTNQSLRERFRLSEKKSESVSRAIRDTVEANKIKPADPEQISLRYRHYVPFWA